MKSTDRRELLRSAWVLPADVKILPAEDLSERVRQGIEARPGEFAVTRPGFRTFSRIVDGDTIALLDEFRTPKPLAEGIVSFARGRGLDPETVLREAFPVLQTFAASLLLVPGDSYFVNGIAASFVAGQIAFGFEIKRLVQVLQDTEVYLGEAPDGRAVALKIARPASYETTRPMLAREAAILERLCGIGSPRLLKAALAIETPYLAMDWVHGVPISARAAELRIAAHSGWRTRLHDLCADLVDTYARLHARNVVHGDVHPRNILIDADDRISVLDFGLGRILESGSPHDHAQRAGFSWNTEPEAAASLAVSGSAAAASTAGEQFSIASVVYTLICGEHYSGAAPTRDDLLKKVTESRPLPFARHRFESWPEVEEVLARALSRDPAERYASTDAFAAAFRQTSPGRANSRPRTERRNRILLERLMERVGQPERSLDQAFRRAPTVSTHYGAAGLAYFLYRASLITESPRWIAAADQWSRLALAGLDRQDAFESVEVGVSADRPSLGSMYYGRSGIHLVHALISNARGDRRAAEEQARAFSAVLEDDGPTELLLGRSGVLLGATLLLESARSQPGGGTEDLSRKLARAVDRAWCDAALERIASRTPRHLGIAHGDAGVVYAQLRARVVLGMPIPSSVYDCLRDLVARGEPSGRGWSWPGTLGGFSAAPATPGHAPGWCAGSAGHVHLWLLAHRITNDASFLSIAERAAWHCWEHDDRTGHLCCGLAGRAYALLELYKHTGETSWLERAETLVDRSHAWVDAELRAGDRPLSLFWGALGPLLAALELERPELAAMPLFASEGWPT